MAKYRVDYNPTTRVAHVNISTESGADDSILIGTFDHPDPIYPGSLVMIHAVRDLLYKRKPDGTPGFWPDNITDMANIKVNLVTISDVIKVTELTLTPETATLTFGGTLQLVATKVPENATENVRYSSSNPAVVSVSASGLVTSLTDGVAIITATAGDVTATSTITSETP